VCNVQISDSRLIEIEILNKTKMKFIALLCTLAATVHGQLITADDGAPAASGIERAQCGVDSSCMAMRSDCAPSDGDCGFVQWQLDNDQIAVTLHFTGDEAWVGVGFSRDREMGQDDIYYCQRRTGRVGMISAYSVGMSRPIELGSDVVDSGIGQVRTYQNGNEFVCSFRRPISVTKDNLEYDLASGEWHILLSTGSVNADSTSYHGPSASGRAISSTSPIQIDQTPRFLGSSAIPVHAAHRAHAILMLLAWALLAPIGLLIARLMRRGNAKLDLMGQQAWFTLHRGIMSLVVLVTTIAIITIFASRGGWSRSAGAHGIVGIITFVVMFAQPVMAYFRPDKMASNRLYFNIAHHGFGYILVALSITTIFLGFDTALLDLGLSTTQLYAASVIFTGVTGLVTELFKSRFRDRVNLIYILIYALIQLALTIGLIHAIAIFTRQA